MKNNINEFTQFFPNPAISIFNRSCLKDTDIKIGPLYPLYWDIVNFGNSAKGSSGHKMRLAPLLAPTFANLQLQEHTAVVPLRTIMSNYEDKFNYALHPEGASLPSLSFTQLYTIYNAMSKLGISPIGSIFDFLGYPVFGDLYKIVNSSIQDFHTELWMDSASNTLVSPFYIFTIEEYDNTVSNWPIDMPIISGEFKYRGGSFDIAGALAFIPWLMQDAGFSTITDFYSFALSANFVSGRLPSSSDSQYYSTDYRPELGELIAGTRFETVQTATEAYINYLFMKALNVYTVNNPTPFPENFYSALPVRAYWRFCYDFLQNGNYTDVIDLSKIYSLETEIYDLALLIMQSSSTEDDEKEFVKYIKPLNRLWDDDFYTSLLPSSKVDNAVEIPANSTVLDLAKLSAFQRFVMKLSYSSRYRDTVWNIFKVKPSDARLQQSSVIHYKYHNVGIGETIQTSETSVSSVLGSFAGRGYSSGRSNGYHIFCEEPCVLLSFVSLMPKASYADALHPLIHVTDTLDFPLPDMDVLGNQPIYSDLLSGNPVDSDTVMGYGRQYQEWLLNYNTVHNSFKTSLDYWQLTRRFNETPVVNDDFLRINEADDFDQIFSVPNASHATLSIFYDCKVSRPVHRNVRIII